MIKLSGQTERSFIFPADLERTYLFYHDIERLITYLPHIDLVEIGEDSFRVRYSTTEMGTYEINIICDLTAEFDEASATFAIRPVDRLPAIKPQTTMTTTTARGYFSFDASFRAVDPLLDGDEVDPDATRVDYAVTIQGKVPRPKGLRFMPRGVVSSIASGIATSRMREIADGFETNAITDFQQTIEA